MGHKGKYQGCLGEFLLEAGEEQIVRAGLGDTGERGRDVLQDKFRLLCGKLKSRISMVALTEIPPIPQVRLRGGKKAVVSALGQDGTDSQRYALGLQELENFWGQEEPERGPCLCQQIRIKKMTSATEK